MTSNFASRRSKKVPFFLVISHVLFAFQIKIYFISISTNLKRNYFYDDYDDYDDFDDLNDYD